MFDLLILALAVAFVSVATLGHILLGVALLTGGNNVRKARHQMPAKPSEIKPAAPANDARSGELAA